MNKRFHYHPSSLRFVLCSDAVFQKCIFLKYIFDHVDMHEHTDSQNTYFFTIFLPLSNWTEIPNW